MAYKITIDANGGTGGTTEFYANDGSFYSDSACTTLITAITMPTRVGYTSNGCWSSADGGEKYITNAGNIRTTLSSLSITADMTIYARWTESFYRVTIDKQGGTGGTSEFYYKKDGGGMYADIAFTTSMTAISPPTRECYEFDRAWSAADGGTKYTDGSGNLLSALYSQTLTSDITIYVHWSRVSYKITVDKQGGTGGTDAFYKSVSDGNFYAEEALATQITGVTPPTKSLNTFMGLRLSLPSGMKIALSSGTFKSDFISMEFEDDITAYASWQTNYVTVTIDKQGGTGGTDAFYAVRGVAGAFYADAACTTQITAITPSSLAGYSSNGCWSTSSGGDKYITNAGVIRETLTSITISDDITIYARWNANSYTLTFDFDGGTGTPASKSVTYGEAIGELPTPTRAGYTFYAFAIEGTNITASTTWSYAEAKTAKAIWTSRFGDVVDYFGLGSSTLIAESSDSGDTHQHTCAYNATSEAATTKTSGIWRNPRVTYRVVGDMTLAVTLGAAWSGGSSLSGYMISAVEVHTAIGEPPSVTVSAVANEGANAIKTYAVSIPISARHRPQNLLSAVSGGGDLQELTLAARCDPVVVAEDGMPCASDICHGRIEVSATTVAYENESAPTAGTGFVKTEEPVSHSGTGYKTFTVAVRKELS